MELDQLTYSVTETAQLLNVSKHLVYEAVHQRKLKVIHFGRRIIVPANSIKLLLGLLEAKEVEKEVDIKSDSVSWPTESY